MMDKMGFASQFIDLILLCVFFVWYFIVANGQVMGPCIPERGLREGDLLSPYLFILCAEGLSALIADRVRRGLLHGCKVTRFAPTISHLFFR